MRPDPRQLQQEAQGRIGALVSAVERHLSGPDADASPLAAQALRAGRWLQSQGDASRELAASLQRLEGLVDARPNTPVSGGRLR